MIPFPESRQTKSALKQAFFQSPLLWMFGLLLFVNIISLWPRHMAQAEYQQTRTQFQERWAAHDAMSLAAQGIKPSREEEEKRQTQYLHQNLGSHFYFQTQLIPLFAKPASLFLGWIFIPGFSLLLVLWFMPYASLWFEAQWNKRTPLLGSVLLSMGGGLSYLALVLLLDGKHPELPFSGFSIVLAFAVGVMARLHKGMIPLWIPGKPTGELHPWVWAAIWFLGDFAIQVFVNPINYGFGFALDLSVFGLAIALAPKLPLKGLVNI